MTDETRFELGVLEFNRLWNYWLGLPVPPRAWRIQKPRPSDGGVQDEL